MEIFLAYISVLFVAYLISIPKFKEINRRYKEGKNFDEIFDIKAPSSAKSSSRKSIDELKQEKKFVLSQLKTLSHRFLIILNFPVGILRLVLIFRFGQSLTWKMPFHLYEIWWFIVLGLCYRSAHTGSVFFALAISAIFSISMVLHIISNLEIKNNSLRIQTIPEHKLHISDLVVEAISVVIAFGCIFFSLSRLNPSSFNQQLDIIDSIYFSFMVGTTVGLGHIHPASKLAQMSLSQNQSFQLRLDNILMLIGRICSINLDGSP